MGKSKFILIFSGFFLSAQLTYSQALTQSELLQLEARGHRLMTYADRLDRRWMTASELQAILDNKAKGARLIEVAATQRLGRNVRGFINPKLALGLAGLTAVTTLLGRDVLASSTPSGILTANTVPRQAPAAAQAPREDSSGRSAGGSR